MANAQFVYSSEKKRALNIGVRYNVDHGALWDWCERRVPEPLRQIVAAWIQQIDARDAHVHVEGYDDAPWEVFIDGELYEYPDWTIDTVDYAPDDMTPLGVRSAPTSTPSPTHDRFALTADQELQMATLRAGWRFYERVAQRDDARQALGEWVAAVKAVLDLGVEPSAIVSLLKECLTTAPDAASDR